MPGLSKLYAGAQKVLVSYVNKQQAFKDAVFVNLAEDCYGNVGAYDLENQYRSAGLFLAMEVCNTSPVEPQIACKYGLSCYRKNPAHFAQFPHPPDHPSNLPPKKWPKN